RRERDEMESWRSRLPNFHTRLARGHALEGEAADHPWRRRFRRNLARTRRVLRRWPGQNPWRSLVRGSCDAAVRGGDGVERAGRVGEFESRRNGVDTWHGWCF